MASFKTKMTDEKYKSGEWPGSKTFHQPYPRTLESDIRVVLRDHFEGSSGVVNEHLDHIDRLLEYYTGRGSEGRS